VLTTEIFGKVSVAKNPSTQMHLIRERSGPSTSDEDISSIIGSHAEGLGYKEVDQI